MNDVTKHIYDMTASLARREAHEMQGAWDTFRDKRDQVKTLIDVAAVIGNSAPRDFNKEFEIDPGVLDAGRDVSKAVCAVIEVLLLSAETLNAPGAVRKRDAELIANDLLNQVKILEQEFRCGKQ